MCQELSRLWRRLRSLQYQPELGAGVAHCQVVENTAQRNEDAIGSRCDIPPNPIRSQGCFRKSGSVELSRCELGARRDAVVGVALRMSASMA